MLQPSGLCSGVDQGMKVSESGGVGGMSECANEMVTDGCMITFVWATPVKGNRCCIF